VLLKPFSVDPGEALGLWPSGAVDDTLSINKPKERLIVRRAECGLMPRQMKADSFDEGRCRAVVTVACNKEQPEDALQNAEEKPWGHGAPPACSLSPDNQKLCDFATRFASARQVLATACGTSDTFPSL
jgi:hypothetical protein